MHTISYSNSHQWKAHFTKPTLHGVQNFLIRTTDKIIFLMWTYFFEQFSTLYLKTIFILLFQFYCYNLICAFHQWYLFYDNVFARLLKNWNSYDSIWWQHMNTKGIYFNTKEDLLTNKIEKKLKTQVREMIYKENPPSKNSQNIKSKVFWAWNKIHITNFHSLPNNDKYILFLCIKTFNL